jgi:hypothetical protein
VDEYRADAHNEIAELLNLELLEDGDVSRDDGSKEKPVSDRIEAFMKSMGITRSTIGEIASKMSDFSKKMATSISLLEKGVKDNQGKADALKKEMSDISTLSKDKIIIVIALPVFTLLLLLLLCIPYIYRNIMIADGKTNLLQELFSKEGLLIKLFTIFILVFAIMLLGLGSKLEMSVIGTLLGSISAYILQGSFGSKP